ncbi:MAG: TIGR01620 family protein [Xanthobacteraceae bacterium]
MSKRWQHRRPAAFRLDDDQVIVGPANEAGSPTGRTVLVMPEPESATPAISVDDPTQSLRRGFRWGTLFWCASGGLLLLAVGLAVTGLIEDLFARSQELGWLGLALAILAAVSLVIIGVREAIGLLRLATMEKLHRRAADTILSDNRIEGRALVQDLIALTRRMPRLARARASLEGHLGEIIDGADLVRLAERELMTPLDQEARRLVGAAAKRVSVVTAVNSRAAIDMLFVLGTALGLVRRLSFLYGVRPGTLGLIRLMRLVVSHLAMTGGLAASDSLIQQILGHGIAAKLSARLGEGMLNGLLTARLGLAAIDVTRPLPFAVLSRPTLRDLMSDALRGREDDKEARHSQGSDLDISARTID